MDLVSTGTNSNSELDHDALRGRSKERSLSLGESPLNGVDIGGAGGGFVVESGPYRTRRATTHSDGRLATSLGDSGQARALALSNPEVHVGRQANSMKRQIINTHCKSSYRYDELIPSSKQIRLLTLYPAAGKENELHGSLETVSVPSEGYRYEALSYTWGDEPFKQQIHLDSGILAISQNLGAALRSLRLKCKARLLWVDAICINQSCDNEKNHQVRQMRDIFTNASNVLVWLGESDADMDQAMQCVQMSTTIRDLDPPMIGLRKICKSSWWTRVWVVQEILVAKIGSLVFCGEKSVYWKFLIDQIQRARLRIPEDQDNQAKLFENPRTMFHFLDLDHTTRRGYDIDLMLLLRATSGRLASDPRDHVYALLGLVTDRTAASFYADYTKPVDWVYQKAMVHVIESRQDLEWLVYAATGTDSSKPSWCIDFSKDWTRFARAPEMDSAGCFFTYERGYRRAAGQEFPHDIENGTLGVNGTEVGRIATANTFVCRESCRVTKRSAPISRVGGNINSNRNHEDLLGFANAFRPVAESALRRRLCREDTFRKLEQGDLWRVAAAEERIESLLNRKLFVPAIGSDVYITHPPDKRHEFDFPELEKETRNQDSPAETPHYSLNNFEDRQLKKNLVFALESIAERAHGRCFFTTVSGYIGRANHEVRKNDVVCILYGCRFPAVLRPQSDGTHKLITFAYTDDAMDGQSLEDGNYVEKNFVLS